MTQICKRCGEVIVEPAEAHEVYVTSGGGWASHAKHVVICPGCGEGLERFLAHRAAHDELGGALEPQLDGEHVLA